MGNANGREDGVTVTENHGSNGERGHGNVVINSRGGDRGGRGGVVPSDFMNNNNNTPPLSPSRTASPLLFPPQVPVALLQRPGGFPPNFNQMWQNESAMVTDNPSEKGIPTIITWNYGGNDVAVEGSWDNWSSRKQLQRSGKDHSVLLVLPAGIYHYKFIVDGEWRHTPDVPFVAVEMGNVCNLLDVRDYVADSLDSVAEFEAPPSPDSSYRQAFPGEEDFAKEPALVPPQLHLTVLNMQDEPSTKPRHCVLNHLYIEKGWGSQSLVALGMTQRFESKYVSMVLYKPLKR